MGGKFLESLKFLTEILQKKLCRDIQKVLCFRNIFNISANIFLLFLTYKTSRKNIYYFHSNLTSLSQQTTTNKKKTLESPELPPHTKNVCTLYPIKNIDILHFCFVHLDLKHTVDRLIDFDEIMKNKLVIVLLFGILENVSGLVIILFQCSQIVKNFIQSKDNISMHIAHFITI